jgi:dihydroorotate dehydrogenase electron transfer subunit
LKQVLAAVISNEEVMPGYHLVRVQAPNIAREAKPGQFIAVSCGNNLILRRPLSIHKVENLEQISLLFSVVGVGTRWLAQCRAGERLDLLGPLGNGFLVQPETQKILLAAGGIGIAPLVFLGQKALGTGKLVKLILGAPTKNRVYPSEHLPDGIEAFITTEDGSEGQTGKVTDIIRKYIDWADQIYACGPLAMYQSLAEQSRQWQSKKQIQISLDVRLGCGIGACLGCSIKTKEGIKQVCHDGPVFNLDEVILEEVKL